MFLPKGYSSFRAAAFLLSDDGDSGTNFPTDCERLGSALASGELAAEGIVVGAVDYDEDPRELGEIRSLRPETWRTPGARDAVIGKDPTERLVQDGFVLCPIIETAALFAWDTAESAGKRSVTPDVPCGTNAVPGLSYGVHAVPAGYVTFDQITNIARTWAKDGNIEPDLMVLLDPPDTDAVTAALATGSLRAFGINKRTGAIVSLSPAIWRMEVSGAPQSIWAIGGHDVLAGPDREPCLPVITRADLARSFQAKEVPPDPDELPDGWQAAVPLRRPSSDGCGVTAIDSWMRGVAQGYKLLGKTLKRDDAVKAATTHLHCTTRQAEAAFEALPYPDLRNPPRASAAA